jgi:hypothetical protein
VALTLPRRGLRRSGRNSVRKTIPDVFNYRHVRDIFTTHALFRKITFSKKRVRGKMRHLGLEIETMYPMRRRELFAALNDLRVPMQVHRRCQIQVLGVRQLWHDSREPRLQYPRQHERRSRRRHDRPCKVEQYYGTPPLVMHHCLPEEYASHACNFKDLRLAS